MRFQGKYKETVVRNGGGNVDSLEKKVRILNRMIGLETETENQEQEQEQEIELPDGYSINEFGEIIRPDRNERQPQIQSQPQTQTRNQEKEHRTTRFGATINPNSYSEYLQPILHQTENKLTLRQRVAQFLQKNNLFMKVPFVERFVTQQLNALPETTQESNRETVPESVISSLNAVSQEKTDFENRLSNNGLFRNLPPIQRMTDPQKIEELRRKNEQDRQANEDNER